MRPSPTQARTPRRLPVVTTLAAALCAAAALLAPASSAQSAALAETVVCETIAQDTVMLPDLGIPGDTTYEGAGTVTCKDDQGQIYLEGTSTFSGSIPAPDAADGITPVYRARVDWNDGTVTTGTFTLQEGDGQRRRRPGDDQRGQRRLQHPVRLLVRLDRRAVRPRERRSRRGDPQQADRHGHLPLLTRLPGAALSPASAAPGRPTSRRRP